VMKRNSHLLRSPCDDCTHRDSCAQSGQTCTSYNRFVANFKDWRKFPRVPTVMATRLAALSERDERRRDAREQARVLRKKNAALARAGVAV
jgi:hypothetical protein